MKRQTKRETNLKLTVLLCAVATTAVSGSVIWMAAGFSGLVLVSIFAKQSEPELAPVRVRSQVVRKNGW